MKIIRYALSAVTVAMLLCGLIPAGKEAPGEKDIEVKKRKFLQLLTRLPVKKQQKIILGEFACWGPYSYFDEIRRIHERSGVWVGMLGLDYHDLDMTTKTPAPLRKYAVAANETILKYGSPVCNMSMHLNNPFHAGSAWSKAGPMGLLFRPGSEPRRNIERQWDSVAAGIRLLQDKGVLVMLRPYHEMNGDWFWWGGWKPADYRRLWELTYDYFTQKKGLKNIVWCYSPFCWPHVYTPWYPGDRYVDVVCLDLYDSHFEAGLREPYDSLMRLGKPFGLGEYGCMSSSDWFWEGREVYDFSRFAGECRDFPGLSFVLAWNLHWGFSPNKGLASLRDSLFINREELGIMMEK